MLDFEWDKLFFPRKMACPALVSLKDSMRSNKSFDISRTRVETNNKQFICHLKHSQNLSIFLPSGPFLLLEINALPFSV